MRGGAWGGRGAGGGWGWVGGGGDGGGGESDEGASRLCRDVVVESSACAVARDGDAALERVDNDERYICSCFHARETDV